MKEARHPRWVIVWVLVLLLGVAYMSATVEEEPLLLLEPTVATEIAKEEQEPLATKPRCGRDLHLRSTKKNVFRTVQACLRDSPYVPIPLPDLLTKEETPKVNLTGHFLEILEATRPFRNTKEISYAGYNGPWIERVWVDTFCCNRSLDDFGGMVPLFIQWTDMSSSTRDAWYETEDFKAFFALLRPDVLYVTVSQNDNGINNINERAFPVPELTWNIFVMSAGGFGHMPIPLLIQEQPVRPLPQEYSLLVSFVGTMHGWSSIRTRMVTVMNEQAIKFGFHAKHYSGPEWLNVMSQSMLNLTPRGYGRSSFHIYETIQMGYIPMYLHMDHEWLPYQGTCAHLTEFGFSVHIDHLESTSEEIALGLKNNSDHLRIQQRREKMLGYRESHYTFGGVMQQIEWFLKGDPRSDLSCHRHPVYAGNKADPGM